MKLKSKLIATIVSICAAIAVMGVGVWAASTSFTVHVNNTVQLSFVQLDGTVTMAATSGATALQADKSELSIAEAAIYDSTDESKDDAEYTVSNDITSFLTATYVDASKCTSAYVEYTFKYTAAANITEGMSDLLVSVDETAAPSTTHGEFFKTYYFVSENGTTWYDIKDKAIITDATTSVWVKAICVYENEDVVSFASDDTTWNFDVVFNTSTEGYTEGAVLAANTPVTVDATANTVTIGATGSTASAKLHTATAA